jgi:hypothetical protein
MNRLKAKAHRLRFALAIGVLVGNAVGPFDRATVTAAVSPFTIGQFALLNTVRVGRTTFENTYSAQLTNTGAIGTIGNVTAQVQSLKPSVVVIDGELTFGSLAAGATGVSQDTFKIRVDRQVPFAESDLQWTFAAAFPTLSVSIQASPKEFLVGSSTQVRIQAQVTPDPSLNTSSVQLRRVGGPILCNLLDNGILANGDDVAGDSVYSCFVTFLENAPSTIGIFVTATVAGQTQSSGPSNLLAVNPLSQADAQLVFNVQQQADDAWHAALAQLGDTLAARQQVVNGLKTTAGVQDAGISTDLVTIWILYTSGLHGGLMLNPVGTRGAHVHDRSPVTPAIESKLIAPPSTLRASSGSGQQVQAVGDTPIGNNNVLIWDAYNSQFAPFDEGPGLQALFNASLCPKFNVTYLVDAQATVNSVKTFTNYGTIILVTHGAVDGQGQVVFLTRENASIVNMLLHGIDLVLGRISVMGQVFAIRPSLISSLPGSFPDANIYNGSCQSSANSTMGDACVGKGAKTYHGFTRVVNSNFAQSVATQLFTPMVQKFDNTGTAFGAAVPKVDPTAPNATFTQQGDPKLVYDGELKNGDFEKDLTSWTVAGDARSIPQLGLFTPQDGAKMSIISTGLGFTTSSGSIEQNLCLKNTATHVAFSWHYSSEEFKEWCGPQHPFDDPFVVEIIHPGGTTQLLSKTVDSLCALVVPSGLAFDQSKPGCVVSPNVGVGTGGQDCTVWTTGWQAENVDISALAISNNGAGVKLRFRVFDAGDSIFDTAVLLDKIRIVP